MHTTITAHGAVPGRLASTSIQAAIDAVAADGGGMVLVPPGEWLTGMIRLKDRVRLHLDAGAVLRASGRIEDYAQREELQQAPYCDVSGSGHGKFHLILADHCRDIAITGQGRIDGNGTAFYTPGPALSWPLATDNKRRMRSCVEISHCANVVIEDVTIGNTCNWTLHLHESDTVRVRGVRIDNPGNAPNADGIDIGGCRGVTISDCHINTCDDAICLKTYPGGRSCEDIAVSNCVIRTHCVALKLGCVESFADMRNVVFSNCTVRGSHRAVGIYSLHGGHIENIQVVNVVCDTCLPLMFTRPIHLDVRCKTPGTGYGSIRNVLIAGLTATTTGRILLTAAPGVTASDIRLRDITLRYVAIDDPAIRGAVVGGGQFSNANPWARSERAALVAENIQDLDIHGFNVRWPTDPTPSAWRFPQKMANGAHDLYLPADWGEDTEFPFAAVSARGLRGGRLVSAGLTGRGGAQAVRNENCQDFSVV